MQFADIVLRFYFPVYFTIFLCPTHSVKLGFAGICWCKPTSMFFASTFSYEMEKIKQPNWSYFVQLEVLTQCNIVVFYYMSIAHVTWLRVGIIKFHPKNFGAQYANNHFKFQIFILYNRETHDTLSSTRIQITN